MIKLVMSMLLMCLFAVSGYAEVYRPSEVVRADYLLTKETFEKNPRSDEARFNYAMSCAYTGKIKTGWDTLKLIPEDYAAGRRLRIQF